MRALVVFASMLSLGLGPVAALAHVGHPVSAGVEAGFAHPFDGIDHAIAALAVGFWATRFRGRIGAWVPLAFLAMLVSGFVIGVAGPFQSVFEWSVAGSAVLVGLAAAFDRRGRVVVATTMAAVFGLIHGHAHGVEMPDGAASVAHGFGLILATIMLVVFGGKIGLGLRVICSPHVILAERNERGR